ncbi:response regulator [Alteriqipengyuania flavescens]|uniref:response regulator n=1 Tax=Alteriqipengyuania flavescens TaxID=3053610 RepID=UPI0025B2F266|nr:response regulator [Alteriqipengyuania flavescens]WJY18559.1 response regulator [Alteriqipengyuania flavescens]WJY24499.1 response regulator [Alteriqipengyuania flavescens]
MAYIVIADDDELVAEMASDVLINAGHACGWVTDAEKTKELLAWRRPDVLLLDHDMPGLTGAQLLRELRNSTEFYDLPVIMFTKLSGETDEAYARLNGAQDFIRKPFDPSYLKWRVERLLEARADRPRHRSLEEVVEAEQEELKRRRQSEMRRSFL